MNNSTHIVISGPSASGKSTLIKKVLEAIPTLSLSISHTTRPKRRGEVEGKDYYFVSVNSFESLVDKGQMLEYATFNNNYYGTSYGELKGNPKIFDVEYHGVSFFRKEFPEFIYIFIECGRETVKKRLKARGDSPSDIQARLKLYDNFVKIKGVFDRVIDNDRGIDESSKELIDYIKERMIQ